MTTTYEMVANYFMMIKVTDVIDMAIIAFVVYNILIRMRSTTSVRILQGVLVLLIIMWLSTIFDLRSSISYWAMRSNGVSGLIILFQPELRRALEKIGSSTGQADVYPEEALPAIEQAIKETVTACTEMSQSRTGVLLVFERENQLDDILRSGTKINADVSSELLKNIFFIHAPMHDGAAIVPGRAPARRRLHLPLSKNVNLSRDLGIAIVPVSASAKNSDAVVVLVSGRDRRNFSRSGRQSPPASVGGDAGKFLYNELLPNASDKEQQSG